MREMADSSSPPDDEQEEQFNELGRLLSWRLLNLIDAYRTQKEVLELDDIDLLGRIAQARFDLHDACAALSNGCTLEHAVIIFT